MITFINSKSTIDHTYGIQYKGIEVGVYARSLHEARQRAVEHFRLRKSQVKDLIVNLYQLGEGRILIEEESAV